MPFKDNPMDGSDDCSSKTNPGVSFHEFPIEYTQFPFKFPRFLLKTVWAMFSKPKKGRFPDNNKQCSNQ